MGVTNTDKTFLMFIGELEEYPQSIHLLKLWQEQLMLAPNGLNTAYAVFRI